jgi:hypothetical protein
MDKLHTLWQQQVAYNKKVRAKEPESQLFWAKQYLLGLVAEVDEVLQELNWKSHRYGKPFNQHNFARELADIQKYSWCLWELFGFSADDMLNFVEEKSNELDAQWEQDWEFSIPDGSLVVITDLDGTVGNWRKAFRDWILHCQSVDVPVVVSHDHAATVAIEVDLGIAYPTYIRLKEQFEASGGYADLPPYPDAVQAIRKLKVQSDVVVIAYTARPASRHTRIWLDTWTWLRTIGLDAAVSELRIGGEERISRACELKAKGCKVILLEDDPGLAIRAATAGIDVCLRAQPYNAGISHDYIARVQVFNASDILAILKEQR